MVWDEHYKLQWIDFKGKPDLDDSAAATTASGITLGISVKHQNGQVVDFTTNIKAHFYPEHSWFKKKHATDHVLGHEQLHFDITELYARKFRKRVQRLSPSNNIRREIEAIYKSIQNELSDFQNLYDAETNFSRETSNQLKWEKFIASELNKLDEYKYVLDY